MRRFVGCCLLVAGLLVAGCGGSSASTSSIPTVPSAYRSYFVVAARRCPDVLTPAGLAAQAYVESHFRPTAVSAQGAEGLMQIIPAVWAKYGTDANGDGRADPFTPADSIATGAKYNCALAQAVRTISGDQTRLRLAAYNAGLNAVRSSGGVPPYPETERYVQQIEILTDQLASQFTSGAAATEAAGS